MSDSVIEVEEVSEGIQRVIFNRPEKRNALSIQLMEELCEIIEEAQDDPSERVLIFQGAGSVFCSGLDLDEAREVKGAEKSAQHVARVLELLHQTHLVTIACVHGAALAGGAGIMSACDIVVAAEGTKFGYPETRRGLVAALVLPFLLRQVGDRYARELLLLADIIDTDRALTMGLINEVVSKEELEERCLVLAEKVLLGAPQATAYSKRMLRVLAATSIEEDLQMALEDHVEMRRSPEAQEGIDAFFEKRAPAWCQQS